MDKLKFEYLGEIDGGTELWSTPDDLFHIAHGIGSPWWSIYKDRLRLTHFASKKDAEAAANRLAKCL